MENHLHVDVSTTSGIGAKLHANWGRYPRIEGRLYGFNSKDDLPQEQWISRGMGRSYGDASLGSAMLETKSLKRFLAFDEKEGILSCESGLSLREVAEVIQPKGWKLPVCPGTQFVSIGGAIAAEVHGKNHHLIGAFSDFLISFQLLAGNGNIYNCSRGSHRDLFYSTIGGMGLTGIILSASLQLVPFNSNSMEIVYHPTEDLEGLLATLETHNEDAYLAAWFDAFHPRFKGWVQSARYIPGNLHIGNRSKSLNVPSNVFGVFLNRLSMRFYNRKRIKEGKGTVKVPHEAFLYPLDQIKNWNRLYGRKGFIQYQFVIPKIHAPAALEQILEKVRQRRQTPYLCVLKKMGSSSPGLLAFPQPGISLAMDFPIKKKLWACLDELDEILLEHQGKIYLAKDARMSAAVFAEMYPRLGEFQEILKKYGGNNTIRSAMAERLEII